MAELLFKSSKNAYVRLGVPLAFFEKLVELHGGSQAEALRTIRLHCAVAVAEAIDEARVRQ